jgi:hypothetical protein
MIFTPVPPVPPFHTSNEKQAIQQQVHLINSVCSQQIISVYILLTGNKLDIPPLGNFCKFKTR